MFIYQPVCNSGDRVAWYGGESTQLHYEVQVDGYDGNPDWITIMSVHLAVAYQQVCPSYMPS